MSECKVCDYAEQWLRAQHTPEWYIGDATSAEWDAAYAAANDHFAPRAAGTGVRVGTQGNNEDIPPVIPTLPRSAWPDAWPAPQAVEGPTQ